MIRMIRYRRGQGMTEYIIIVGLVAVLLMVAVGNYRFAVDEAIQGTKGAVEGVGKTSNQYSGNTGTGTGTTPTTTGRTPAGMFNGTEPVFMDGGVMVFENGTPLSDDEKTRVTNP